MFNINDQDTAYFKKNTDVDLMMIFFLNDTFIYYIFVIIGLKAFVEFDVFSLLTLCDIHFSTRSNLDHTFRFFSADQNASMD